MKHKNTLKLGLALLFAGAFSAKAQYNVDYKMGPYTDARGVESTVDIGEEEVVTVGNLRYSEDGVTHTDIILTRLNKEGKVVWNYRYGDRDNNEVGHGITLSWDKRHVIVVGSKGKIIDGGTSPSVNLAAYVLKIRISDGAVIWSTTHGRDDTSETGFVVKRSNGFDLSPSYVVVGSSSGDEEQSFERMYAFKIRDDGNEVWNRRYYLSYNFPINAIRPTSMVEDGAGRFMIAGIRQEVNRPSTIFTIGINQSNGSISKDQVYYTGGPIYTMANCDIDRHPEGKGYAISFRSLDFFGECEDAPDTDVNRIGIIRLDDVRRVLWSNVYWEKEAANQGGFSVDFYKEELRVCVNINRPGGFHTPGILRVKEESGGFLSCNTYHVPESFVDYGPLANNMIVSDKNDQYYVKSIYRGAGFSMVNPDISTRANCDKRTELKTCRFEMRGNDEKCEPKEYGRYRFVETRQDRADFGEDPCEDDLGIRSSEEGGSQESQSDAALNKAIVYPSPVGEGQDVVNLRFTTDLDDANGNVKVFNSQGQEVINYDTQFIIGENNMKFDAQQFAPGMYMVIISANGEIMDQVKFVKN